MNKKCLSCIHCEVCSFIDSGTAKLEACDFYIEGCEDCISRTEVIKSIDEREDVNGKVDAESVRTDIVLMPSVTPTACIAKVTFDKDELQKIVDEKVKELTLTQEWIPVSEGLPEDRRAVLVTAYWHETYQVMMASYYGDGLWWCVPFNNCGEHMQRLKPKAWMPLPKPYKAESEGKE